MSGPGAGEDSFAALMGALKPFEVEGVERVRASIGATVLDELVAGFDELGDVVSSRWPRRCEPYPVLVAVVPWLTDDAVVDALVRLGPVCVVVDKGISRRSGVERLMASAGGIPPAALAGLDDHAPRSSDGDPQMVGPYGPWPPDELLDPVRVAGWSDGGAGKPLAHAKLAVAAAVVHHEHPSGIGELVEVVPVRAWVGSANWTETARRHLEVGLWIDDERFAARMWPAVCRAVALSEPLSASSTGPDPDLVPVAWDEDELRQAAGYVTPHDDSAAALREDTPPPPDAGAVGDLPGGATVLRLHEARRRT